MKVLSTFTAFALISHIYATALPEADAKNTFRILPIDDRSPSSSLISPDHTLEKRKGGAKIDRNDSGSFEVCITVNR